MLEHKLTMLLVITNMYGTSQDPISISTTTAIAMSSRSRKGKNPIEILLGIVCLLKIGILGPIFNMHDWPTP
jgi:hypothetical protein